MKAPAKRALPIIVTSEMVPINSMTTMKWEAALIEKVGRDKVLGSGNILPLQTLSVLQFENLDRLALPVGAIHIANFLLKRAKHAGSRFTGTSGMGESLGELKTLKKFDDEVEKVIRQLAPQLFSRQE